MAVCIMLNPKRLLQTIVKFVILISFDLDLDVYVKDHSN